MATVGAADRTLIEDLEGEISTLKESISKLRAKQKRARKRLNAYKYPILTLPDEMISEIFLHFIPPYPRCPPRTGRKSPLHLTHICRKWRVIALATPALWRAVSLGGLNSSEDHVRFLEAWLSRSGTFPLSIQMHDDTPAISKAKLEAVGPHRARLEHVDVHVESLTMLLPLAAGPLPLLRTLEIRVGDHAYEPSGVAFRGVPLLRAATLWDFTYPTDFVPWGQLTSLSLVDKEPDAVTRILKWTPQLVHCELMVCDDEQEQPYTTLPHLKTLTLMKYDMNELTPPAYLNAFILPSLRRLQIPDEFLRPDPVDALGAFIKKSGCKLREVFITGDIIVPKSTYRDEFPEIKKFAFDRGLIDYSLRRKLINAESEDEAEGDEGNESASE
ncbi:hypothetical protein B0H11DRAFT_2015205 [Mycena galericulata]|nr:hypothetical protein B0H11DRAFT_2015205 [Mycena galericulata]